MAEQKSVAALQTYLALAKGVSGKACADIIMKVTEQPGCYVFGELLDVPNIKALEESPDYRKYIKLLRIFAYGSYSDYLKLQSTLPELSAAQILKLKQLSLITLASQARTTPLTYAHLLSSLEVPTVRALEDLIISCIYAGLLDAKLDTLRQRVEVRSTAGRDIAPGDVAAMLATMENWSKQCENVLAEIDAQIRSVYDSAAKVAKEKEDYNALVQKKKDHNTPFNLHLGKGKRVIPDGEVDEFDEMDVDDGDHGMAGSRRRKRMGAQKKR